MKIKTQRDEVTDFPARKIPDPDSNYICCSVILIDSVPKNHMKTITRKCFQKNTNTLKKKKTAFRYIF